MESDEDQAVEGDGSMEPPDVMFGDDSGSSGARGSSDDMVGFFRGLNIIDITEVFSPPRVVTQGAKIGLKAGSSMDLMTGWNFELKEDRERAIRKVKEEKPKLLIGSPPCTYFSMLQELNKHNQRHNAQWLARFNENLIKAIAHIKFCIELYKLQMDGKVLAT